MRSCVDRAFHCCCCCPLTHPASAPALCCPSACGLWFSLSADTALASSDAVTGIVEAYEGAIDVYETKNKEIVKQVQFSVVVCSDADAMRAAKQERRIRRRIEQRTEQRER